MQGQTTNYPPPYGANRYVPPDYYNGPDPYARPQSNGGTRQYYDNRQVDRRSDRDRPDSRRGRGEDRRRENKSQRSRSQSSGDEGMLGKIKSHFDSTGQGMQSAALGALAGGIVGHEVGKHNPLAALAGVIIGGLGANAWDKMEQKHNIPPRDKKEGRKSGSRSRRQSPESKSSRRARSEGRGSRYDDDGYSQRNGQRGIENGYAYGQRQGQGQGQRYQGQQGYGGEGRGRGAGGGGGGQGGQGQNRDESPDTDEFMDDGGIDSDGRDARRRAKKKKKKTLREKREKEEEMKDCGPQSWKDCLEGELC